ncbi:MAG TPA: hypothetical protein VHK28_02870 [Candidatus Limnocylindria bacterium]|nr:hypothetical protein [Candidatus Limnocylindria bacterium]
MIWRWSLAALLLIHGGIHLLGFLASTGLAVVPQISAEPTLLPDDYEVGDQVLVALGALWLVAFLGFAASAIGLGMRRSWWLRLAVASAVLSTFLIVLWWPDAAFGLVPNLMVFVVFAVRRF